MTFDAHVIALASALIALVAWVGSDTRRAGGVALVVSAVAAWTAWFWMSTTPEDIPISWLSGLQEGTTHKSLQLLAGDGAHGGSNMSFLQSWWRTGDGLPLRRWVHAHVWLTGVDWIVLVAVACSVLGSVLRGLVAGLVFAVAPTTFLAATSESPAAALTAYLLLGVITWAGLGGRTSRFARVVLIVGLTAVGALLTTTRFEFAAVALLAMAVVVLTMVVPRDRIDAVLERAGARVKAWAAEARFWKGLLAFVLIWPVILMVLPGPSEIKELFHVTNPEIFMIPVVAASIWSPGAAGLMTLGVCFGLWRWRTTLLLPLSTIVLFKSYIVSAHGGSAQFEVMRYATLLMGPCYLLMLAGWWGFEQLARQRAWPAWWRWAAAVVLVPATLAGMPVRLLPGAYDPSPYGPLPGVQQAELRYIAGVLEEYPDCALITPVTERPTVRTESLEHRAPNTWAVFGHGRNVRTEPRGGDSPSTVLSRLAPESTCRFVLHSTTCSLVGAEPCPELAPAEARTHVQHLQNIPYYRHVEYRDPVVVWIAPAP